MVDCMNEVREREIWYGGVMAPESLYDVEMVGRVQVPVC